MALACICLGVVGASAEDGSPQPRRGRLRGYVLNASTGGSMGGVSFLLRQDDGSSVAVEATANGLYEVDVPRQGAYQIGSMHLRRGRLWPIDRAIEIGDGTYRDLAVREDPIVELRIVDGVTGNPVEAVEYREAVPASAMRPGVFSREVLLAPTDVAMRKVIATGRGGNLRVRVEDSTVEGYVGADGYAWQPLAVASSAPNGTMVRLYRAGGLKLHVIEFAPETVLAEVRLRHIVSHKSAYLTFDPVLDTEVRQGLPAGDYEVRVRCETQDGHSTVSALSASVRSGHVAEVVIPCQPRGVGKSGRTCGITVPSGWNLQSVVVRVMSEIEGESFESVDVPLTHGRGEFTLRRWRTGGRLIVAVWPTGWAERVVLDEGAGRLDFAIPPPARITFRAVDPASGTVRSDATFRWGWKQRESPASALVENDSRERTDEVGSVLVPAGRIGFNAFVVEGGRSTLQGYGTVVAEPGAAVVGTAMLGRPPSLLMSYSDRGQRVAMDSTDYSLWRSGELIQVGSIGNLLEAEMAGLSPGRIRLLLTPPTGFAGVEQFVDLVAGEERHLRIELTRGE